MVRLTEREREMGRRRDEGDSEFKKHVCECEMD